MCCFIDKGYNLQIQPTRLKPDYMVVSEVLKGVKETVLKLSKNSKNVSINIVINTNILAQIGEAKQNYWVKIQAE